MPNHECIAATGKSIERLLGACFRDDPPVGGSDTKAVLVQTEDFDLTTGTVIVPAVSIFLYRVEPNAVMRAAWGAHGSLDGRAHLPLDLHFLITAWGENAEHELLVLGKALECLESTPLLSGPLLYPTAEWEDGDLIQLVPADLGTESLLRLFDSLDADFRLSVPYVARIARIDGTRGAPPPQVTTAVAGAHP